MASSVSDTASFRTITHDDLAPDIEPDAATGAFRGIVFAFLIEAIGACAVLLILLIAFRII